MPFKDIEEFCTGYRDAERNYWWVDLDRALADLCLASPLHQDVGKNYAKMAIINRTYRAYLHLGGEYAEWQVAEQFKIQNVDSIIEPIRRVPQFSLETLPTLLDAHEKPVEIVKNITTRINNSFVSKYLHFHFPAIAPIFDSYAYKNSWAARIPTKIGV